MSRGVNVQENMINESCGMTTSVVYEDLKKKGLEGSEIEDIQYLLAPQYASTFMVFAKTAKEEYLVPYCTYDKDLGFESGKLYKASELVSIFAECDARRGGDKLG